MKTDRYAVIEPAGLERLFHLASVDANTETLTVEFAPDFWGRPQREENMRHLLATIDTAIRTIAERTTP